MSKLEFKIEDIARVLNASHEFNHAINVQQFVQKKFNDWYELHVEPTLKKEEEKNGQAETINQ